MHKTCAYRMGAMSWSKWSSMSAAKPSDLLLRDRTLLLRPVVTEYHVNYSKIPDCVKVVCSSE